MKKNLVKLNSKKRILKLDSKKYYIGIDGGGTSSKSVLINEKGDIIDTFEGKGSNLNNIGLEQTITNLLEILNYYTQKYQIEKIDIFAGGLSGAGRESDRELIKEQLLKKLSNYNSNDIFIHHDAFASLMGATAGEDGAIAIAGTGSIVYGIKNNQEIRAGGWGYLLGDEGSGYYIGNNAIRFALLHYDNIYNDEDFYNSVLKFYHINTITELIPKIYQSKDPKKIISSICIEIFNLAQNGNKTAQQIIDNSNKAFSQQIVSVINRLKLNDRIIYPTGSLFKNNYMINNLSKFLQNEEITIGKRKFSPEIGMVIAAIKNKYNQIDSDFIKNLEKNFNNL